MRTAVILAFLVLPALGAPPSTCGEKDDYSAALCAYQHRQFATAEKGFRELAESESRHPQTIRAMYFLARTLMKTGRYDEASRTLIRIYDLDKPFYDAWSCDFLLGECRRAQGKT